MKKILGLGSAVSLTVASSIERVTGGEVEHAREGSDILLSMNIKTAQALIDWIQEREQEEEG